MKKLLSIALLLAVASLASADVELKVPEKIEGKVGTFIVVKPETPGKIVKYKFLDEGLSQFPSELLKDSKCIVVTTTQPGSYRVAMFTGLGDDLSDLKVVTIVVTGSAPLPPPPPPPPAPPPDKSELGKKFQKAYDDDGKGERVLFALKSLYEASSKEDFLKIPDTWQQLGDAIARTADGLQIYRRLPKLQQAISDELKRQGIPSRNSTDKIGDAGVKKAAKAFSDVAKALGEVSK